MAPIKSKVTRDLSMYLTNRFLKPEIILKHKGDWKFWPREIKMIGQLFTKYPNEEFWITLNITFFINSFAYFISGDGANELEKQWRLFCVNKKIDAHNEIDKKINLPILELNSLNKSQVPQKKNVLDWIDN